MKTPALIKNSSVVLAGTLVANIANYLFNLLLARQLGPADYGILVSLFALAALATTPAAAITPVAVKYVADFRQTGYRVLRSFWGYLTARIIILGLFFLLAALLLNSVIARFLNITNPGLVFMIMIFSAIMFLATINRGFLQGLERFSQFSWNMALEAVVKLIIGVGLAYLGWRVFGALLGPILGITFAYLLSTYNLRLIIRSPAQKSFTPRGLKKYSLYSLGVVVFSTLLINSDVILVKHFFPSYEAGLFGSLSTAAKILLFLSAPIVTTMFPMIANLVAAGKSHWRLLLGSLTLVLATTTAILAVYIIAPGFALKVLFGSQFTAGAPFLAFYALGVMLYSLSSVLIQYYLSIKQRAFILPVIGATILEIGLIWFRHSSFSQVIANIVITQALLTAALFTLYLFQKRKAVLQYALSLRA